MTGSVTRLVAGLGNPGGRYALTRHNAGFMVADALARRLGCAGTRTKFSGLVHECRHASGKVVIVKPMTFMNLSGKSVVPAMMWHDIELEDAIVVYDDLDLPFGQLRLRQRGNAGGHNGLSSVIQHLGTLEIPRLRFGIGRPPVGDTVSYVLSRFTKDEEAMLPDVIDLAVDALLCWADDGIDEAMNRFNRRDLLNPDPEGH
jgi:peptidyl-tRNA hydrolase, PTH1 family